MDRNAHARDALLIAPTPRSSADPWTRDFIGRWGRSESSRRVGGGRPIGTNGNRLAVAILARRDLLFACKTSHLAACLVSCGILPKGLTGKAGNGSAGSALFE